MHSVRSTSTIRDRDPSSFNFYYMLREQTLTLSRAIPELYLISAQDSHLQMIDPNWHFIDRRLAVAADPVSSLSLLSSQIPSAILSLLDPLIL